MPGSEPASTSSATPSAPTTSVPAATGRVPTRSATRPVRTVATLPTANTTPNPALAAAVADAGTEPTAARARGTVAEPMTFAVDGGEIRIEPRPFAAGAVLDLAYGDATFACELPPGGADPGTVTAVTGATTPYLAPDDEEAVTHAVADVVSDVVVLGGLEDVRIEATLGDAYHALTVGAARAARERGLYRERTADGGTRGDGGSGPGPDSGSGTGTGTGTETGDPE